MGDQVTLVGRGELMPLQKTGGLKGENLIGSAEVGVQYGRLELGVVPHEESPIGRMRLGYAGLEALPRMHLQLAGGTFQEVADGAIFTASIPGQTAELRTPEGTGSGSVVGIRVRSDELVLMDRVAVQGVLDTYRVLHHSMAPREAYEVLTIWGSEGSGMVAKAQIDVQVDLMGARGESSTPVSIYVYGTLAGETRHLKGSAISPKGERSPDSDTLWAGRAELGIGGRVEADPAQ